MLEVSDLHVSYDRVVRALQGVSLHVADGKIVAVLGSNGAGKSTLMRAVSATLRMHPGAVVRGGITSDGTSLAGLDAARTVRLGIVQVVALLPGMEPKKVTVQMSDRLAQVRSPR